MNGSPEWCRDCDTAEGGRNIAEGVSPEPIARGLLASYVVCHLMCYHEHSATHSAALRGSVAFGMITPGSATSWLHPGLRSAAPQSGAQDSLAAAPQCFRGHRTLFPMRVARHALSPCNGRHRAGPESLGNEELAAARGGGFVRLRVLRPPREESAGAEDEERPAGGVKMALCAISGGACGAR